MRCVVLDESNSCRSRAIDNVLSTTGRQGPEWLVEGCSSTSCSALRKEDGTYAPAHLLYDIRMERAGRNSVCEDSRSAPTGAACCLPSNAFLLGSRRVLWLQQLLIVRIDFCQCFLGEHLPGVPGVLMTFAASLLSKARHVNAEDWHSNGMLT